MITILVQHVCECPTGAILLGEPTEASQKHA
jgi:hypothetical protein